MMKSYVPTGVHRFVQSAREGRERALAWQDKTEVGWAPLVGTSGPDNSGRGHPREGETQKSRQQGEISKSSPNTVIKDESIRVGFGE